MKRQLTEIDMEKSSNNADRNTQRDIRAVIRRGAETPGLVDVEM